ncbi:hypothetical protein B484DRAFT_451891 [Ochromonadaceae sp. CCMP2298]|nr:hypothetical protein B484DRAFT_451891 [Ochromonadaceae sp. CCMP2298]
MAESYYRKLPFKVILLWMVVVAIFYNLLNNGTDTYTVGLIDIPASHVVDAIVFIAMGKMAADPMVDYAVASARMIGKWQGDIFIITDRPECFAEAKEYEIKTIQVPVAQSLMEIKALKTQLMSLLPEATKGALYLDVDILVTKNLTPFLRDLGSMIFLEHSAQTAAAAATAAAAVAATAATATGKADKSQPPVGAEGTVATVATVTTVAVEAVDINPHFDFAAFLDAKGHYVGFCSGCEKWHSGILWLRRGKGEGCLARWREELLSGKFESDQESLDAAEKGGACPNALSFPSRHLLFAKDYIAMTLTSGQTFVHLTSAGRLEDSDWLYREWVVPAFRNSLHPPLNPDKLKHTKTCSLENSKNAATAPIAT